MRRKVSFHCSLLTFHFSLFAVLCSLLICSCPSPSPLTQTLPEELPQGFGSFSLSVNAQRTILPGVPELADFAVYTLAFTAVSGGEHKTEDRTNAQLAESPVILAAGTYSLTVRAYKDTEKTKLAARGTLPDIVIDPGVNSSQTVTLRALGNEGSGTFNWSVDITASGVTDAEMAIKRNNAHISGSPVTLNTTGVLTNSLSLGSGVYNLRFTLKKDAEEEAVWNEVLYVYAELESDFSIIFDDDFFYRTCYNVTFVYYNGDTDSSQSVEHGDVITMPGDPTRAGYTFGGWYTDAALTVPYDDFNAPVYNDFSLYAKWAPITFNFYDEVAAYATAAVNRTIIVPQNITLHEIVTIPANTSGVTLTITSDDGGPRTLSRGFQDTSASRCLFMVGSNARLIVKDIIIDGNKDSYTNNSASLVRVNSGGTFTMESGAVLQNSKGSDGNVYINGGTFNMNGGEISDNIASGNGGGVYINGGTFNMNGGEMSSNISSNYGGGVYVSSGTFTMSNGTITGNTASGYGGGVYINGGTFTMSNGTITGNTTNYSGGGVYINSGTFSMTGGEVTGNISTNTGGGGVYFYSGTFRLGGIAKIKLNTRTSDSSLNNVYLANTRYITLGTGSNGANIPTSGMEIYINGTVTTSGVIVNTGAAEDHAAYFRTDDDVKAVAYQLNGTNGQLVLADKPIDFYAEVAAYATAATDKTIAIRSNITLDKTVTIPPNTTGAALIITSAGGPYTLSRGYSGTSSSDALFIVGNDVTLQFINVTVNGKKNDYEYNAAPLVRVNSGGTFTMENGAILQDNLIASANAGGGVYVDGGTFTMNGGEISGNIAAINGGGVYVSSGTIRLGGTAKIKDNTKTGDSSPNNVYLENNQYITPGTGIIGEAAPDTGMEVYVQTATANGVIVESGATAGYAAYFHADDDGKEVLYRLNGLNGQLVLADKGSAGITLNVEHITTGDIPLPADNLTLSRSGAGGNDAQQDVTIDLDDYDPDSVTWEIFGAGSSLNITETNIDTFTLDATDINYNSLGGHTLRLTVKIEGVSYMVNINFTIVE